MWSKTKIKTFNDKCINLIGEMDSEAIQEPPRRSEYFF